MDQQGIQVLLGQPDWGKTHVKAPTYLDMEILFMPLKTKISGRKGYPDRAPLIEVLGGQYNYREGGRQVLRQGAKGRRRNRKWQCSKDPCAQKVSGGRTDPSPKYRWKVHG